MSLDNNDSCRVTPLEYSVEFPCQKGFGLKVEGGNVAFGLAMCSIENIGGDVSINMEGETLAMVSYREVLAPDFTLDGYEQRAKKHAQCVINKIAKTALQQAAFDSNVDAILKNAIISSRLFSQLA